MDHGHPRCREPAPQSMQHQRRSVQWKDLEVCKKHVWIGRCTNTPKRTAKLNANTSRLCTVLLYQISEQLTNQFTKFYPARIVLTSLQPACLLYLDVCVGVWVCMCVPLYSSYSLLVLCWVVTTTLGVILGRVRRSLAAGTLHLLIRRGSSCVCVYVRTNR